MSEEIMKATEGDKRRILTHAIQGWLIDYDETYIYYEEWGEEAYKVYKVKYTFNGTSATISEEKEEVVALTEYKKVVENGMISKMLRNLAGNKIEKSYDFHYSIEPLYIATQEVDGVGDAYFNSSECFNMVNNLNKAIEKGIPGNYFHKLNTDHFEPIEAFCFKEETVLKCGDIETTAVANQPYVVLKFNNDKAFDLRKSGDLMGVSIGATVDEIIDITTGKTICKNAEVILGSEAPQETSEEVVKRLLKGIRFDSETCHIALTDASQGGACSLKNDPLIIKAMKKTLTKEQKDLLTAAGYDISEIEKSMSGVVAASASEEGDEVESKTNEKTEDMTQLEKDLAEMKLELAKSKAVNALAGYSLDKEVAEALAGVMAVAGDNEAVCKALDAVVASSEAKLEAKVAEAVEKAKQAAPANPVAKSLEEEVGTDAGEQPPVELTKAQRIAQYLK